MSNSDIEQIDQENIEIVSLPVIKWREYKELRLRALQEEPQAFGSSYEENVSKPDSYWMQRLKDVEEGKDWLLFAKESDKLIGMMGGFRKSDDLPDTINVIAVYVVAEARGRGVSKKLMQALLDKLEKSDSIKTVKLSVNKKQISAIKLYGSSGFKIVGEENVRLGDGNHYDELLMERTITR